MCVTWATGAEVVDEDVVTEVGEVGQLSEMTLQWAAGKTGFVERSQEAKHKRVQTGGPGYTRTHQSKSF